MKKVQDRIYEPTILTPIPVTGWRIEDPRPDTSGSVHIAFTIDITTLDAEEPAVQCMAVARIVMPVDFALEFEREMHDRLHNYIVETQRSDRRKKG